MPRLTSFLLIAAALATTGCDGPGAGSGSDRTETRRGHPTAIAAKAKLTFVLRGRSLTLVYRGRERRSSVGYALHNDRVRYACYTSLWASLGQDEPRGSGVARARTTKPFPRGARRKTVVLDRDISGRVGACVVESLRLDSQSDAAVGMFVPVADFVRRDAPSPADLSARPGERTLDTSHYAGTTGVSLFLGERHLRIALADDAPISIQRDFRTQSSTVLCTGSTSHSARLRFPLRSREAVARFPRPLPVGQKVLCGVEAGTGTEAYGSTDAGFF